MSTDRPRLTRQRALDAAVALADAEGIDAVSMRHVAARLGVAPMALYKHLANKEDLLSGMIDTILDESTEGQPTDADPHAWRAAVRRRILGTRAILQRHRWARGVIETRRTRTPRVLAYMDALAGLFMAGGFTPATTHAVMHALGHRIWGFSPEAFDDPDALTAPADPESQAALRAHVASTYPHILAIAEASEGRCDEDAEFVWALDLLLDAFERLRGDARS